MDNLIKIYKLEPQNTKLTVKRINKLFSGFYEEQADIINPQHLDNSLLTIELLEAKYSLLTVINTIWFILKVVFDFYGTDENVKNEYTEIYSELLCIREKPESYEKITFPSICEFIETRYTDYLTANQNFTKTRNFVMLALLLYGLPLKLHNLMEIKYFCYEGVDFHETAGIPVSIVKKNGEYYLVLNKNTILERIVIKLEHFILHRLLGIYTSKFLKNKLFFFSTATGLQITKPNMANGFINFTRKELGIGLTIYDIRKILKKTNTLTDEKAFTF